MKRASPNEHMHYLPELYYFFDQKGFPLHKAVLVTAKKVAEFSTHYQAKLLSARKGIKEKERSGILPKEISAKHKFIEDISAWIIANSHAPDLFTLFLDDREIGKEKGRIAKCAHHDDTCCWILNIGPEEFKELQATWKREGLPEDLFYPGDKAIRIQRPDRFIDKFLNALGFTGGSYACSTPKRWEHRKR